VEREDMPGLVALVSHHDDVHVETLGTMSLGHPAPMKRDSNYSALPAALWQTQRHRGTKTQKGKEHKKHKRRKRKVPFAPFVLFVFFPSLCLRASMSLCLPSIRK